MKPRSVREQVSAEEWQQRVDLACAHRLIAESGIRDLTYNHLSARVPGEPGAMLIKNPDQMFEEVTASSLHKYDIETGGPLLGASRNLFGGGLIIHAGLLGAKPNLNAVFHTHSAANIAVASHKCGLLPISQHAFRFHDRLAYHRFRGYEFEIKMREWLIEDLGEHKAALLENHGALTVGESVAEAFVLHHSLESACRAQVGALAAGLDNVKIPPPDIIAHAAEQVARGTGGYRRKDWEACLRKAERIDPRFKE